MRVLIVDDDGDVCRLAERFLTRPDLAVRTATSGEAALAVLADGDVDLVLTDVAMEGIDGLTLCSRVLAEMAEIPIVVMTASRDIETAIAALRAGATDFVTKPFDAAGLEAVVARAIRGREVVAAERRCGTAVPGEEHGLLGESASMQRLRDMIDRVARCDAAALVTGESGSGKELVARAIHARSLRRDGPFVVINCAAIPDTLLESELFGHVQGAFTDARRTRRGLFAQADGGTIFLDEVAELPLTLQPKLLRAVQERRVRPVGADAEVPFDARFVIATHRDLRAEVAAGRFRDDLFYRLVVVQLDVPPLRVRGDDVLLLARHFMARHAAAVGKVIDGFTPAVADRLSGYRWPGNVRELENCIERAVAFAGHRRLAIEDLPLAIRSAGAAHDQTRETPFLSLAEVERRHVQAVLDAVGRNVSRAARVLGIDRKTLCRKLGPGAARSARRRRPPAARQA